MMHTVSAWITTHPVEALSLAAAIASAFRSAWRRLGPQVHARYPRLGHLADLLGALWPDIEPAARALVGLLLGLPYRPQVSPLPPADVAAALAAGRQAAQRGRAHMGDLVAAVGAVVLAAVVAVPACHPLPPAGDAAVPSTWASTVSTVLDVLGWALPAADAIVTGLLPPAAAAPVHAAFRVAEGSLSALRQALATYQRTAASGDRCAARAAIDASAQALIGVADALSVTGYGLAPEISTALSALAAVGDELAPACPVDGGLAASRGEIVRTVTSPRYALRPFPPLPQPAGARR